MFYFRFGLGNLSVVWTLVEMDSSFLARDELQYELKVRGADSSHLDDLTVLSLRNLLQKFLIKEPVGDLPNKPSVPLDSSLEISICKEKLLTLQAVRFSGSSDSREYFKRYATLTHLMGRVSRIATSCDEWTQEVLLLKSQLRDVEDSLLSVAEEVDADRTMVVQDPTTRSSLRVPVFKWDLRFSGDGNGLSINAFLERVEEFRVSRGATTLDLFNSATDLFSGPALIWFRSVRDQLVNWKQLVEDIREQFQPPDYEYELWQEIRERTQGPGEPIGTYVACMLNLFARLPNSTTETQRLQVIRRNLNPFLLQGLALAEVSKVKELLLVARKLEATQYLSAKYRPPSATTSHVLEPDLGCPSQSRKHPRQEVQAIASVEKTDMNVSSGSSQFVCWNCDQTGHSFSLCKVQPRKLFCFICGEKGVTKAKCPKCSKNE